MAFFGCSNLNNITIPNSVTYIGSQAFYNCKSLTIKFESNTPPKIDFNFYDWPFAYIKKILVPIQSLSNYTSIWSSYYSCPIEGY